MKRLIVLLLTMFFVCTLTACAQQPAALSDAPPETCGHEEYLPLIEAIEADDYDGAHSIVQEMTGWESQYLPAETTGTVSTEAPAVADSAEIRLNEDNLLEYFSLVESCVLREPVICLQSLELKDEYARRLVDLKDVQVQISCYDTVAYGAIERMQPAFLPEHYDMVTGDLEIREIPINALGDGVISQLQYDDAEGCFKGYAANITIHAASGTLVLEN